MYSILDKSEENAIGVKLVGKVSKEERDEIIAKFRETSDAHGKIRILIELDEFEAFGSEALAVDMEYILPIMNSLEKFAFVSNSKWQEWYIALDKPFALMFGITETYFDADKIDEAWKWLKED